ncbi:flagellar hook-length control protein FliK [Mitsuaria sp. GD03876]|uniref:flagellar hook-length control protein FliK n=1 Tax=Mitsuaria sp. GD03876 TaxID=2975399 RepID=UPI00244CC3E0|nr:flagellar hook-length control protein FliK [Mitsuaria sp. GD03876]MDH0868343.1 flagellar hook-length control protein FliK [Mitsuaria sp. GD03876]
MNADDTRGDVAAASPADQDGAPDEAVDVLDAALAQALEDLLGGNLAHTASAAGDAVLGVVVGGKKDEDTGSSDATAGTVPPTTTAPLMAMLMPTLMPAVMPPAPAARGLVSTDDATPTATRPLPDVPSALTADPARLLALQGTDGATPALGQPAPAGSADTANAANAANTAAWQGLQRWSADLMSAMATTPAPGAAANDAGGATLSLPAARDAWSQPLMQALGDRLQLQIAQRADSARLHLEPPQLGRIEIDIRQQGGALQVQLSASHDEVRQQLRQIAEPLRHELVQRHAGEVSVQVASGAQAAGDGRGRDGAAGGQPQSQGQPREQRQPGRALDDDHANTAGATNVAAFADAFQAHAGTTAASGAAGAIGAIGALGGHAAPLKRTSR